MTFTPRMAFLGFLGASLAILATAYGFEYLGGLKPCILCLYQRVPYGLAIGLSLGALFFAPGAKAAAGLLGLLALIFLGNGGLAIYHVGVEQGIFAATEACGASAAGKSLEALRQSLLNTEPARCDAVAWSLFGISMAGYNALASIGLAAAVAVMARRIGQNR